MSRQGSGGNVIAALCNFFFPGLGQLIQGRLMSAIFFFAMCAIFYGLTMTVIFFFLWPVGAIFQLWSIIDAARYRGPDNRL